MSTKQTSGRFMAIDDWFFRVLGKGLSVQPLNSENHVHLFSVRNARIKPLHLFNHCWRILI